MVKLKMFSQVALTCEHGGNEIPRELAQYFRGQGTLLRTHRGWDIGALKVAEFLADRWKVPLDFAVTSRLVVDLNRSTHHPKVFSEFTKPLLRKDRDKLLDDYYYPYRQRVEKSMRDYLKLRGSVLHLSIHSFTPELNGEIRNAEVGILYDPARVLEREFAQTLIVALRQVEPSLRIRANYPYKGVMDGFQPYLRKAFTDRAYAGLEIELNQGLATSARGRQKLQAAIVNAIDLC